MNRTTERATPATKPTRPTNSTPATNAQGQQPPSDTTNLQHPDQSPLLLAGGIVVLLLMLLVTMRGVASSGVASSGGSTASNASPSANANGGGPNGDNYTDLQKELLGAGVDIGASLDGTPAPDFTLTNQFNQQMSLKQFRGKVVILSFNDSQCTTICPLTSQTMIDALKYLPAKDVAKVQLLAVNANPTAYSVQDVKQYSVDHGMENRWFFLTGSPNQLNQVWHSYRVDVQIIQGNIDHTPALYVIDPQGHEQTVYQTSGQYGVVGVESYTLARDVARLLPDHPAISSKLPPVRFLDSLHNITVPTLTAQGLSKNLTLGPNTHNQQLLTFFFASWAPDIQNELVQLNRLAQQPNGPRVVAVDVGSAEPTLDAAKSALAGLSQPLAYPVVYDATGEVADAYHTQDIPWFTLTDAHGNVLASNDGWLDPAKIIPLLTAGQ